MSDFYDEIPSMLQHYRFKSNVMRKLNNMGAPTVGNILSTISKQGTISHTTATQLADTAIKSRNPNYIAEIQKQINTTVMDSTPTPYKPLVQAISDSLTIQSDAFKSVASFDERRDYYNDRINKLPTHQQTGEINEILDSLREDRKNLGKYATASQYEEIDQIESKLTEQLNFMNILTQYDSDPSTPEIDPPDKLDYPLDAQIYESAERIRKGYAPSGDFAGGIGELEKLASTDKLLERQAWAHQNLMTKEEARILLKSEKDKAEDLEKIEDASNKDQLFAYKADRKVFFDEVKLRTSSDPSLDFDKVVVDVFSDVVKQDNYTNGNLNSEDFMHVIRNLDPSGENRIEDILKSGDFGSEIGTLKSQHLRNIKNLEDKDARTTGFGGVKTHLSVAFDTLDVDMKKRLGPIIQLSDAALTTSVEETKAFNAEIAINEINRSILEIIEEEDRFTWLGGVDKADDILYSYRSLNSNERKSMDEFFNDAFLTIKAQQGAYNWTVDPKLANAMDSLLNARDELYKMIDANLLNQRMDIATGAGDADISARDIGR